MGFLIRLLNLVQINLSYIFFPFSFFFESCSCQRGVKCKSGSLVCLQMTSEKWWNSSGLKYLMAALTTNNFKFSMYHLLNCIMLLGKIIYITRIQVSILHREDDCDNTYCTPMNLSYANIFPREKESLYLFYTVPISF